MNVISWRLRRSLLACSVSLAAALGCGHVGLAYADSAVARDGAQNYFDGNAENLSEARDAAVAACKKQGGKGCHVVYISKPHTGGFGAAIANATQVFYASGFEDSDRAFDAAAANCRQNTRQGENCELLAQWEDWNYFRPVQQPRIVQNQSTPRSSYDTPPRDTRTWHYEDDTGKTVGGAVGLDGSDHSLVYR
jgi:hypothetical protein